MSDNRPHASALRRGRFSQSRRVYLVTTTTREREPVFRDFAAARALVRTLMHEERTKRAQTLAYVVMPDHLHWLMRLGDGAALSSVVRSIKSVTSHRVGRAIWQAGFHDRALRRDEDLLQAGRYVVANPLRAGLVAHINDYPHWDAIWFVPEGQTAASPW